MTAWISPATWVNGTLTAAFGNAEVRDHLNWLKAALDLVTGATAADTGTATALAVTRAGGTTAGFSTRISGDTASRLRILAGGQIDFGSGVAATDGGDAGMSIVRDNFIDAGPGLKVVGASGYGDGRIWAEANGYGPTSAGVGVFSAANEGIRVFMTLYSADTQPVIEFTRADGQVYIISDSARRLLVVGNGGQGRLGVETNAVGADTNSLFAWVNGDTLPRATLGFDASGRGKMGFGPGNAAPDAVLYRGQARQLRTDDFLLAVAGVGTFVKNGAVTDADFPFTPPNGTLAVDASGSKIYARVGTWKSVTIA
jgi:hypothetical protein